MITLLILLTVFATAAVTIDLVLLALVVYLWKSRQRSQNAVQTLSSAYQSLLLERAFWVAKDCSSQPLYVNKGSNTIH